MALSNIGGQCCEHAYMVQEHYYNTFIHLYMHGGCMGGLRNILYLPGSLHVNDSLITQSGIPLCYLYDSILYK